MCTLVVFLQKGAPFPLIVAANRDEQLSRPSTPPQLQGGSPACIAPRDQVAGGTWLGLNGHGLFVGVTNRFGVPKDERRSSRGQLVANALKIASAAELHAMMAVLPPHAFNAFHLFYADGQDAFVTWSDGEQLHQETLPPGLHVITERSLGGDDRARTELIRKAWAQLARKDAPAMEELAAMLSLHDAQRLVGGTCIHAPERGYGTRSSMILELGAQRGATRMWWAEGNPCTAPYAELAPLLRGLWSYGPR